MWVDGCDLGHLLFKCSLFPNIWLGFSGLFFEFQKFNYAVDPDVNITQVLFYFFIVFNKLKKPDMNN